MIRIRQIKILVENSNDEVLLSKIAKILHIKTSDITSFSIKKKSLDARKKDAIYYIYEVDVKTPKEALILKSNTSNDIFASPNEEYICPPAGSEELKNRPIIVGSGPAGLSAALNAKIRNKSFIIFGDSNLSSKIEKAPKVNNYLGFTLGSGKDLLNSFKEHLDKMGIEIVNERINNTYSMGDYFTLMVIVPVALV